MPDPKERKRLREEKSRNSIQLGSVPIEVENWEYLEYFVRQRRNLLIASVLLFFAVGNNAKFKGPLFGFYLDTNNPIDASNVLAFFVAYFLLRYLQYFIALGNKGIEDTRLSARNEMKVALNDIKGYEIGESFEMPEDPGQIKFKSKTKTIIHWIMPWLNVIIPSYKFTEYVLPFIVSIGVLFYFFYDKIYGIA